MPRALIDTDTLSEVIKGRDPHVLRQAGEYLSAHQRFTFSIITRYEILRGLVGPDNIQVFVHHMLPSRWRDRRRFGRSDSLVKKPLTGLSICIKIGTVS